METMTGFTKTTLDVPGASLYYEVRGSGPLLVFMPGGPADATTFRKIENTLAERYTVVTYDPRNLSHSEEHEPLDDDRMVEIYADDVYRLIDHLGAQKADVFASSGGAVIALELARVHGDRLATVICHEPPCPDFLADPEAIRAGMEDVCDTCARDGIFPAMQKFMKLIGIEGGAPPPPEGEPTPEQLEAMALMQKNFAFFFGRYIRNIARYRPDVEALKACGCRLVPAIGTDSKGQLAHDGGVGMARALGVEPAVFPGDHGGFDGGPQAFAGRLLEVLAG
jgi:pimeloyl-ACP methyl ester carboxylesterase